MLIVLDTNVLISAFLWQGKLKPIYDAIRDKKITPCFTKETWLELSRTLCYSKFKKQLTDINVTPEEIIKLLLNCSYFTTTRTKITEIKEDSSDNNILACAIASQTSFIVSGDKHLFQLKSFQNIPIVTPKTFIQSYLN